MHEVFLGELRKLNTRFMGIGVDVSESTEEATQIFVDHGRELAQSLVRGDRKVSRAATRVEKRTLKLVAPQQPVANDFRNVISILKAMGDLERVGENTLSAAWETIRVKGNPRIPEVETIIKSMSKKVSFMLDRVLKAYAQDDEKLAREVAERDDEVDEDYVKACKLIIAGIKQDPEATVASSSYFAVIRLLGRVGDHVVNLAQWVVYKMSGELANLNTKDTDEMTEP